jgi:hypothetical protein
MAKGRHPGLPLDQEIPTPAPQQAVKIGKRNRLVLPQTVASALPWIGSANEAIDCLGIFEEPGKVLLASWDTATPVLERRRELIEVAGRDVEAAEALRLLEDRYRKVHIQEGLRLTLTTDWFVHLEPERGELVHVYVARTADALQILSPAYRNARLAEFLRSNEDLP